jgi:hypothetical protein
MAAKPNPISTGRAQRVIRYLLDNPKGCTVREIIEAVEPGCVRSLMSGCVTGLHGAGKLVRVKGSKPLRFKAAPDALVDRRTKPAGAWKETAAAAPPPKPAAAARAAIAAPLMAVPARTALAAPRAHRTALQAFFMGVEAKRIPREQLAADVAKFLAAGGKIQHFQPGESAESIRAEQERYLQQRKRGRAAQRNHRQAT